jgi:hypothetical protein
MLLGSQAEKLAQKISMLPTNEYRKWINDRVFDKARQNHRWSGKIRKDSYIKLAASGYNYLLDNCNLNTILDGKYGDIKFAYTLVMLGVKPTEIRDIISKQWN